MLTIKGNLCELGDVLPGVPGLRIETTDSRTITISGLTADEVRGLATSFFGDVVLTVVDQQEQAK